MVHPNCRLPHGVGEIVDLPSVPLEVLCLHHLQSSRVAKKRDMVYKNLKITKITTWRSLLCLCHASFQQKVAASLESQTVESSICLLLEQQCRLSPADCLYNTHRYEVGAYSTAGTQATKRACLRQKKRQPVLKVFYCVPHHKIDTQHSSSTSKHSKVASAGTRVLRQHHQLENATCSPIQRR